MEVKTLSSTLSRRRHRNLSVVVMAIALLISACGSDGGTSEQTSSQEAGGQEATAEPADGETDAAESEADIDPESEADDDPADEPVEETADETSDEAGDGAAEELFPDVLDATASNDGDSWTFSATLSSPYDTPQRYADAWRVVGPDGEVYGIRELTHDHAGEQPFTRSQSGIEIPDDVTTVTVEGRDQLSGWGGATVEVELTR